MKRPPRDQNPSDVDLVYGRWPVREALESGPVAKLLIAQGVSGGPIDEIITLARQKKVPYHWVERRQLDRMVGDAHQGVVAQAAAVRFANFDALMDEAVRSAGRGPCALFLDGVQDPQNVGSLIRSAAFFGVGGVVLPKWRAASLTGTVVRASAGAARFLPVAQVANLGTAMEAARKKGIWLVGADMAGQDARKADLPRPFALVLGAEGAGLHALVRQRCDVIVTIPRAEGKRTVGSLNVGVAGAILLCLFS